VQGANSVVEIAEVLFYFIISGTIDRDLTLACVSCYSQPHQDLLKASQGTLLSCTRQGTVKVIDVKSISDVVAMVPHQPFPGEERFFLVEKPGLDTTIGGNDEEIMDVD
jgi:hypothetical protein